MLFRSSLIAVLSVTMALLGLPLASADVPPPVPDTVAETLEGLPGALGAAALPGLAAASAEDGTGDGDAEISVPVRTPIEFSMVGFTLPEGAAVEFRTSTDGETWSDWHGTDVLDEAPDPDSPEAVRASEETFSAPVWVGEASFVQTRVGGADTDDVEVHLIDSMGLNRSVAQRAVDGLAAAWRGSARPASADVAAPRIVPRSEWGAEESQRSGMPRYAANARAAVVHHTATTNDYDRASAAGQVRAIYDYHTRNLGWDDVGYNILIDRFGTIYEGRYGGLDRAVIGAHAGGWNTGTFGVAMLGQHQPDAANVPSYAAATTATIDALVDVLAWKLDVHHIDATATVQLTSGGGGTNRYASGTTVTVDTIVGHTILSRTECPGRNVIDQMGSIRSRVADRQTAMFVQPEVSPTSIRLADSTNRVPEVGFASSLKPAGAWSLRVTDGDGMVVHADAGTGSTMRSTWQPPVRPGVYRYQLTAPDRPRRAVQGDITVLRDVIERVGTAGGTSAASVELSKAAFPDSGSAEHAVLARADVFADAMAGGPLAGRTGPLLLGSSDRLDPHVRSELDRVLPAGRTVYVLGGTGAISDDVVSSLENRWTVVRLSGTERTATAASVAEVVRSRSGTTTAMLARSGPDDRAPWADALAGGAYGAREGIPVLLTPTGSLTPATRQALAGFEQTLVLGGDAAVSDAVMAQTPRPTRISGPDRTSTAVAIAERLWGRTRGSTDDAVLVGEGFADSAWARALAASPLAAREGAPLLLTAPTTLSQPTAAHLERLGYSSARTASGYVLGSPTAVSDRVAADVSRLLQ